jgi:hypothetical protein
MKSSMEYSESVPCLALSVRNLDDRFPHVAMDKRIPFDPIELETSDEPGVYSGSALSRARDECHQLRI